MGTVIYQLSSDLEWLQLLVINFHFEKISEILVK